MVVLIARLDVLAKEVSHLCKENLELRERLAKFVNHSAPASL
jgi:hypothetical protein